MFSSEIDGVDEDAFNRMDSPGMYPCETVALPLSHPQSAVVKLCLGIFLGGKRKVMRVGEGGRERDSACSFRSAGDLCPAMLVSEFGF